MALQMNIYFGKKFRFIVYSSMQLCLAWFLALMEYIALLPFLCSPEGASIQSCYGGYKVRLENHARNQGEFDGLERTTFENEPLSKRSKNPTHSLTHCAINCVSVLDFFFFKSRKFPSCAELYCRVHTFFLPKM